MQLPFTTACMPDYRPFEAAGIVTILSSSSEPQGILAIQTKSDAESKSAPKTVL
jgi:hypothetical protein